MHNSVNWKSKTFRESPKLGNSWTNQVRNQLAINPCGSTNSDILKTVAGITLKRNIICTVQLIGKIASSPKH